MVMHANAGLENAGPQKHDRKVEDKPPKASTQLISGYLQNRNVLSVISRGNLRDCELSLHV